MSTSKQVVLLIETSTQFGRSLMAGVSEAVRGQLDWRIHHAEFDFHREPPTWLDSIPPDGIISRITNPSLVQYARRTATPLVELTEHGIDHGLHGIYTDNQAIGTMAADYLLGRGFQHFGFCGHESLDWSHGRREAFIERLSSRGFPCVDLLTPPPDSQGGNPLLDRAVARWLASAPQPLAVFACNDGQATRVLRVCQTLGKRVP